MTGKMLKDEQIIREYNYAHAKLGQYGKVDCSLVITNKRIVSSTEGKQYIHRNEIPLMALKNVNGTYSATRRPIAVILIILGAMLALIGLNGLTSESDNWLVWLLLGAGAIVGGIFIPRVSHLDLDFAFYPAHPGTEFFGLAAASTVRFGKSLFGMGKKKTTVYVDGVTAREIMDEITAVLLDVHAETECQAEEVPEEQGE